MRVAGKGGYTVKDLEVDEKNDAILGEIIDALNNISFGHVQITVFDSRIVQIEKTEKRRFESIWKREKGSR